MTFEKLIQILKTSNSANEIDSYRSEIEELLPKVHIMFGYDQMNFAHQYDLWFHCLETVVNLPKDLSDDMVYLAAFLHDIGKPDTRCKGNKEGDTNMHYYGHPIRSMEIVRDDILPNLSEKGIQLSYDDMRRLLYYVEYHDDHVSLRMKHLRRHLKIASLEEFKKLMILQIADAKAHNMVPLVENRIKICEILVGDYSDDLYRRILAGE